MGTISNIACKQGDRPSALPIAVIMQFDNTYTAPIFFSEKPRCVLIFCNKYPETLSWMAEILI